MAILMPSVMQGNMESNMSEYKTSIQKENVYLAVINGCENAVLVSNCGDVLSFARNHGMRFVNVG